MEGAVQHQSRRPRPVQVPSNGSRGDRKTSSLPRSKSNLVPPKASDYAEIFGGFATSCSISVLDLPPPATQMNDLFHRNGCSKLDYSDIFGGFDVSNGFGVSYEDMFCPTVSSANGRIPEESEVHQHQTAVSEDTRETKGTTSQSLSGVDIPNFYDGSGQLNMPDQQLQGSRNIESMGTERMYTEKVTASSGLTHVNLTSLPEITETDVSPMMVKHAFNGSVELCNREDTALLTSAHADDNDPNADCKSPDAKLCTSEDTSATEQYHSCSSSDHSTIDGVGSIPDQQNSSECSNANNVGKTLEDNFFRKTTRTRKTWKIDNRDDGKTTESTYLEGVLSQTKLGTRTMSTTVNSASNVNTNAPRQLANDLKVDSTCTKDIFKGHTTDSCIKKPEIDTEKIRKSPKESTITYYSECITNDAAHDAKQDQVETFPNFASFKGPPVKNHHGSNSYRKLPTSLCDKSILGSQFITVSDINLRTQPSQVPPPKRPPPKIPNIEVLLKTEIKSSHLDKYGCVATTSEEDSEIGAGEISIIKGTGKDSLPPSLDIKVDAGLAAAASAAAMREAMEQAQVRLKSAKETMERKKDPLQSRKKSASKSKEQIVNEMLVPKLLNPVIIPGCNEADQRQKNTYFGNADLDGEANEKYFDLAEESLRGTRQNIIGPAQVPYIQDEKTAQWKVEEQFFELVNNDNEIPKYFAKNVNNKVVDKTVEVLQELKLNDVPADEDCELKDRDDKLKESSKIAEVKEAPNSCDKRKDCSKITEVKEVKEASKSTPELFLLKIDENTDNTLLEKNLEYDDVQPPEDQKLRSFNGSDLTFAFEESEMELNEISTDSLLADTGSEKKKSESFEEIHGREEVITRASNASASTNSESRFLASEILQSHDDEMGTDVSQVLHTYKEQSEDANNTNIPEVNSCTEKCLGAIDIEEKSITEDDGMTCEQDGSRFKQAEHENELRKENSSEHIERKFNIGKEASASMGIIEDNETVDDSCWQFFCEKIIRETQEEVLKNDEKRNPLEVNDAMNIQDMHEVENVDNVDIPETNSCFGRNSSSDSTTQMSFESVVDEKKQANSHLDCTQDFTGSPELTGTVKSDFVTLNTEESMKEEIVRKEKEQEEARARKLEEDKEREREREKDRLAFEKASRETHDRAIAEARERAAVERVTAEARQRALADSREKVERTSAEASLLADRASRERLRAERAAVERATAEARERAVERALAEKAMQEARERSSSTFRDMQRKDTESDVHVREATGMKQSVSCSDLLDSSRESRRDSDFPNQGKYEGESAIRCKARLERHQRTVERAAKALADKNRRDILVQREQAERNRIAEALDADVRRWSGGKEGNLRALLSTLQYILGPDSGWQPVPLTDVLTAAAVKKAYRKATLYVHPDKLQQRGASIQQKYVCEKVFDLLKEAWNRFNSEER